MAIIKDTLEKMKEPMTLEDFFKTKLNVEQELEISHNLSLDIFDKLTSNARRWAYKVGLSNDDIVDAITIVGRAIFC